MGRTSTSWRRFSDKMPRTFDGIVDLCGFLILYLLVEHFHIFPTVFCVKYETKRGGNKFQVVSMISQYDCGSSQLPTVPRLFLNRSSCRRKIRRADGRVWVLVKKVRQGSCWSYKVKFKEYLRSN